MMHTVGEFEKISFEQFFEAMKGILGQEVWDDKGEQEQEIRDVYENIKLPTRATSGSCGYDFHTPIGFMLRPGETIKIPTGVRVKIDDGWWLGCFPRSSLGFKYRMQLDNTTGVIDSDYYYSSNEGHIFLKLTNDSREEKIIDVEPGDALIQAIFIPYGITYSDNVTAVRDGGIGSTGR